ncbi:hypothetical protein MMC07_002553 [Pseudocyphellaria aurata]|nr:hypothetical protein [Pseudocyphellaria aurata]
MAPQSYIPPAANVLGTLGTVFWCIQLIPQIWQNWRQKNTDGFPALMMLLWAISAVPFGVYAVVQNFNLPIQIQSQVFGTLSLVTWAQILMYSHKWPTWKAIGLATGLFTIFAGVEVLLIFTLRGPYVRGVEWPMILVGSIAAVILIIGILPPYPEIWKRRGRVVGINFIFLTMDSLGAYFSLFALVAQEHFDILGGVIYIGVIITEGGIFLLHFIWLFRTRKLRKRAKLEGKDFDDLPEARRWQWNPEKRHRQSQSVTLDVEAGNNTSTDRVIDPSVPRDPEPDHICQAKEVDKRQIEINVVALDSEDDADDEMV